jgi:hypothetical protein
MATWEIKVGNPLIGSVAFELVEADSFLDAHTAAVTLAAKNPRPPYVVDVLSVTPYVDVNQTPYTVKLVLNGIEDEWTFCVFTETERVFDTTNQYPTWQDALKKALEIARELNWVVEKRAFIQHEMWLDAQKWHSVGFCIMYGNDDGATGGTTINTLGADFWVGDVLLDGDSFTLTPETTTRVFASNDAGFTFMAGPRDM